MQVGETKAPLVTVLNETFASDAVADVFAIDFLALQTEEGFELVTHQEEEFYTEPQAVDSHMTDTLHSNS